MVYICLLYTSIENAGPIEGIYQGLLNTKSDFIFVTTCDMPNITKEFINFILQFISHDYDAVIIKDSKGKTYPLFGIYNKSSLSTIERSIMDKNYRLQDLLSELNVKYINLSNTTFDCQKLLRSIDTVSYTHLFISFINSSLLISFKTKAFFSFPSFSL